MARLVVLGGAESGVGAAVLGKVKGYEVFLSDNGKIKEDYAQVLRKWEIPFEEGGHTEEKVLSANEVVKSPGIPCTAPMIKKLEAQGTPVLSEMEFTARFDTSKRICITGSNGKTTTTSLIWHIMNSAGLNVGLGGNIGKSYAMQVATEQHDWYVLEISSFQLDNCYTFRPDVAILTNVTPDHLDRYDHKMENYTAAKFRIAQALRPTDPFIYDADDPVTDEWLKSHKTGGLATPYRLEMKEELKDLLQFSTLSGRHNTYNTIAAILATRAAGLSDAQICNGLRTFQAIEHRLEPVRTLDGVLYINDSKATNIDSAWYALDAQTRPVVWILGGTDKGNDYSTLAELVKAKVKAIVCMGVDNRKIHAAYEEMVGSANITDALSAEEAVAKSRAYASEGDVVLLSPCCASFDLFKNYEDRGRKFKDAVNAL